MTNKLSEKEDVLRRQRRNDAIWGVGILIFIFLTTAYFALKDKETHIVQKTNVLSAPASNTNHPDSVRTLQNSEPYSEYYHIGYEKGYAAGEEDTNDGDYLAGFDDSNSYNGTAASDYCLGYNQGYEDAYEEMAEYSEEEEPI